LQEALQIQPDLDEAQNALTLIYAAMAKAPSAQATPMAAPTGERPVPIAVYVPQPQETPTTPIWKAAQVSCGEKPLYMWSSAGTYLYKLADASGAGDLVVVQRPASQSPRSVSCDLLSADALLDLQAFGDLLTEPFRVGDSKTLSNCTPPRAVIAGHGTMSTTAVGIEPRMTELGAFEAARVDTRMEYSFATGLHDTFDVLGERSEWFVCGYGMVHSTATDTETKNRTNGLLRYREALLLSYTPTSTNESHVRHMLVDMQLSGNIDFYRARIRDEETAEAVRRWDAGVRVVNVDEFERKMVDDRLHIVYTGTRNPILGSDPILTIDAPP
jgi:hypothetical protein